MAWTCQQSLPRSPQPVSATSSQLNLPPLSRRGPPASGRLVRCRGVFLALSVYMVVPAAQAARFSTCLPACLPVRLPAVCPSACWCLSVCLSTRGRCLLHSQHPLERGSPAAYYYQRRLYMAAVPGPRPAQLRSSGAQESALELRRNPELRSSGAGPSSGAQAEPLLLSRYF